PQVQQEVFRLLIDHVVVGENEIVIKHIVPTDDDCRLKPGRRCTQIKRIGLDKRSEDLAGKANWRKYEPCSSTIKIHLCLSVV
ncbi:MAG: hypothetical protein ACOYYJ_18795, partial [Chloroflexota bacterium]